MAFLLGGINFIVTLMNSRAPGMRAYDIPMVCWMIVIASILFMLSVGPLIAGAVMLLFDQVPGVEVSLEPRPGLRVDLDAAQVDRAVLEDRVRVAEEVEVLAHHAQRGVFGVPVVVDVIAEANGHVAAAGAPGVGLDVEIVEEVGPGRRGARQARQQRDGDEAPQAQLAFSES